MKNKENQSFIDKVLDYVLIFWCIVSIVFFVIFLQYIKTKNYQDENTLNSSASAYSKINNITPYSTGETWVINESPNSGNINTQIAFSSFDTAYSTIKIDINITYITGEGGQNTVYIFGDWSNQVYRTITFETAPTGDLLTWLHSNAFKIQTGPTQLTTPIISTNITNNTTYITWASDSNAVQYEIYKDNVLNGYQDAFIDGSPNNSYRVNAVGTYQVKSIGDSTNYIDSDLSNSITITSTQLAVPTLSLNNNTLSWLSITNATHYEIYLNNTFLTTQINTSYTVSSFGIYQVRAINNSHNSFRYLASNLSNSITIYNYSISYNLANVVVTSTDKPYFISSNQAFLIKFEPFNNYNLPQYITCDGCDYTWDYLDGTLRIYNPSSDVYINIQAEYKSGQYTFVELIDSVTLVPVNTFFNLFDFDLFGINIYHLLLSVLLLFIIIKVVLKVFK